MACSRSNNHFPLSLDPVMSIKITRLAQRVSLFLVVVSLAAPFSNTIAAQEANLSEREAQVMLWDAAKSGDVDAMHTALEAGANIQAIDHRGTQSGRRSLNWAAWFNHPEAIIELIRHGVDLDAMNKTGYTPVHHAAESGSVAAAQVLIWAGANVNLANVRGEAPLGRAKRGGYSAIVTMLEEAGAKLTGVQ